MLGVASSGPLIAATLGATTVSALAIAFWRNAIGGCRDGHAHAGPRTPAVRPRSPAPEFRWSLLAAVALALHFACFITSLQLTSVAAATALVCLQSAWIAVFQLFRGPGTAGRCWRGWASPSAALSPSPGSTWVPRPDALLGDVLAVAGGALAGLYTLAGGKARQTHDHGNLHHALLRHVRGRWWRCWRCSAASRWQGSTPSAGSGSWPSPCVPNWSGHTAFNHLLATMSPLLVSMIILLEIPGAALLAAVFLDETLPAGTYAGLALILVGLAVVVLGQRQAQPPGGRPQREAHRLADARRARNGLTAAAGAGGGYWPPRRTGWAVLTVWMARRSLAGKYTEKNTTMGAFRAIFLTLCAL